MDSVREADVINVVKGLTKDRSEGRLQVGIGDDAAIINSRGQLNVVTVDTVTEGTHFQVKYCSFYDIGYRAAATAVSDIAAVGASVGELYIAVTLPTGFLRSNLADLYQGIEELAASVDATVAGGETVTGLALTLTVTVVGYLEQGQTPVLRSGARLGDLVGVTGLLGSATAGRILLERGCELTTVDEEIVRRYLHPEPRLRFGKQLADLGISAMVDISDGLAKDANELAVASGLKLVIDLERLPLTPRTSEVAESIGQDPAIFAATSGDDYELCFCINPAAKRECEELIPVTWIGSVQQGHSEVIFERDGGYCDLEGYEHSF